jgi:hypothetical protein
MILGYKFSIPEWDDYLILFILFVLINVPDFFPSYYIEFLIPMLIFYATVSSTLGIKFSNFYFSLIWIILCWIFYLKNNTLFPLIPLLSFVTYQIVRIIYWKNYHRGFIPVWFHYGGFELRFSKSENRKADKLDGYFSLINFTAGLIIFGIYFIWLKNNELI